MPVMQPNAHEATCPQIPLVHCSMLPLAPQRLLPSLHGVQALPLHAPEPHTPVACKSQLCKESAPTQRFCPWVQALLQLATH
jgi:hypothetical protein